MMSTVRVPNVRVQFLASTQPLNNGPIGEGGEEEDDLNGSYRARFDSSSVIRVDLSDADACSSINLTTGTLRQCERLVLRPYSRLLTAIGWRSFGQGYINSTSWKWKLLDAVYGLLVLSLLFYSYVYGILTCQWKLTSSIDSQTGCSSPALFLGASSHTPGGLFSQNRGTHQHHVEIVSDMGALTLVTPDTLSSEYDSSLVTGSNSSIPSNSSVPALPLANSTTFLRCNHIVTTYVVPSVLHLMTFILGMVYFRVQQNEQLHSLMEKVFLLTTSTGSGLSVQKRLISKLRWFLGLGCLWILLTLALQCFFIYVFGPDHNGFIAQYYSTNSPVIEWILFAVNLVGLVLINCVNVAAILNHSVQCEMLVFYIDTIGTRLKERTSPLMEVMKEVLRIRETLGLLNGSVARMTSMAVVQFAELVTIGLSLLVLNQVDTWEVWFYRSAFPSVYAVMLLFPLCQAARLNSHFDRFKKVALRMRVYGYMTSTMFDLDSFLSYIGHTSLRAKLFHIPVRPSYLIGVAVAIGFTLLILFQSSQIGPSKLNF